MSITDHTRKVLWTLAGNECARCGVALVHAPEAAGDPHAIVGRECHIVARAPSGPRGYAADRDNLDGHENLILLCANCHAMIDSQPELFPHEALRQMKAEHERRIAARGNRVVPEFTIKGRDKPVHLELVESGNALLEMCARSFAWAYEKPESLSPSQRQVVGDFMQSFSDWSEAYDEIGPKGQFEAGDALQDGLAELREEGLLVYATRRQLTLEVANASCAWPEAILKIVHGADALKQAPEARPAADSSAA
ncbi:MAG: HNH endonuclease signature motif containing protein [Solirubrobacteraceae bacterium]